MADRRGYYAFAAKGRIYLDLDFGWPWLLLISVLAVLLEAWLATRERRWLGLLPPGAAFAGAAVKAYLFYAENAPSGMALGGALLMLVLYSVPALLLLAVCIVCREYLRRKRQQDREKMRLDDL